MYLHRPEAYKQKIKGEATFFLFFFWISEQLMNVHQPPPLPPYDKWSHLFAAWSCAPFPLPEYIQKYATEEALKEQEEAAGDSSSESSMSDFSEDEAQDMEL